MTPGRADVLERTVLQATIDGDLEIAALAEEIQSGHIVPFQPVVDGEKLSRTAVRQRIRERLTGRPLSADAWVRELEAGAAL